MKKITFLIVLLITSFGFSQEILIDGDFESGSAAPNWAGNGAGANVVDDGSGTNFVNAALVGAGANVWETNLQQVVTLTQGQAYELSYDAYVSTGSATMISGIAENFGGFGGGGTATPTLSVTSQSFTHTLTFNNPTTANGRVFFDMGGTANSGKTIYIDNVSLIEVIDLCNDGIMNNGETDVDCGGPNCDPCPEPPTTAATDPPARDAGDVASIFTNAVYADVDPSNGVESFGGAVYEDVTVEATNDTKRITFGAPGSGSQYLYISNGFDLTDFTHVHMDVYIEGAVAEGQVLTIQLINQPGTGDTNLNTSIDINAVGSGAWYSADIALDDFNGLPSSREAITLVQLVGAGTTYGPLYFDNLYFYKIGNNICADADPIALDGNTINVSNVGATDSGVAASCDSGTISDVWYSFAATSTGEVYFDTTAPSLSLWSGACASLAEVACNPGNNVAVTGLVEGNTYYVRLNDDGTARAPGTFTLRASGTTLGTDDFDLASFKVFPNPTKNSWTVKTNNQDISSIQVFDILGKQVLSLSPNTSEAKIDGSALTRGLYFATITTEFGTSSKKLIKE